jgi:hypothetical protein
VIAVIKLFTAVILNFGARNFHPSLIFLDKGGSLLRGTSLVSSDLAVRILVSVFTMTNTLAYFFKVSMDGW